jgi:myo-inositol-1-phosphate synthase
MTAYVKRLHGTNVKDGATKRELGEQLMAGHPALQGGERLRPLVMIWCGSTEIFLERSRPPEPGGVRAGHGGQRPVIAPSMIYAWAALKEGVPYANGAPNLSVRLPGARRAGRMNGVPVCGKDFKTGQTLIKTIIAPG